MQPTIKFILEGPFTIKNKIKYFTRFIKWQLVDKMLKKSLTFKFTPNSKLTLLKGFEALSGNYYFGLQEPDVMPFLLHFLRPDDLFVDLGANGGAFTVLAAAEKKAFVVAVEASEETFKGLLKNIEINHIKQMVEALHIAVSDKNGVVQFTKSNGASNRITYDQTGDIVNVESKTLDDILNGRVPALIKMDIEGHEHNAILGALKTISSENCKAIIAEFSNTGEYYGFGNIATDKLLKQYGFMPFKYDFKYKELIPLDQPTEFNMIYIKDEIFVRERINAAPRILISGEMI